MIPDLVPLSVELDGHRFGVSDSGLLMVPRPRSSHWEPCRYEFATLNPQCASCGGTKMLQVHHKLPFHLYPHLELADGTGKYCQEKDAQGNFIINLIVLCENPERLCHHRDGHCWNWKCYNPHVVEDAALHLERIAHKLAA